jgi:hypothetical protein
VIKSLAEAYVFLEHAWPRLIFDGDRLVGFVMAFLDIQWDPDRHADDRRSGLWRLIIAATHRAAAMAGSPSQRSARRSAPAAALGHTSHGSLAPAGQRNFGLRWASSRPANGAAARPSASLTFKTLAAERGLGIVPPNDRQTLGTFGRTPTNRGSR